MSAIHTSIGAFDAAHECVVLDDEVAAKLGEHAPGWYEHAPWGSLTRSGAPNESSFTLHYRPNGRGDSIAVAGLELEVIRLGDAVKAGAQRVLIAKTENPHFTAPAHHWQIARVLTP